MGDWRTERRDPHSGEWSSGGASEVELGLHASPELPSRAFVPPPPPQGKAGARRGGGFSSLHGLTNTQLGDAVEEALQQQLGMTNLHPGRRQGPLDLGSGRYGFEVKACTTLAQEYKVKLKKVEAEQKRAEAKKLGLEPGTMVVVVGEDGTAHVYWRDGIGAFTVSRAMQYAGTVKVNLPPQLTKAADLGGCMVALHPTAAAQKALAVPGGEPSDRLHVTLAYLPRDNANKEPDHKTVDRIVAGWAKTVPPIDATITAHTTFTGGDEPAQVALVSAPGLDEHRAKLASMLDAAGHPPSKDFGFTPHITLAYGDEVPPTRKAKLRFGTVSTVHAKQRQDFRLAGVAKAGVFNTAEHPRDPLSGRWVVIVDGRTDTIRSQGVDLDQAAEIVAQAHRQGSRNVKATAKVRRGRAQTRYLTRDENRLLAEAAARKITGK